MQVHDGYHDAALLDEFRRYLSEEFGFQVAKITALWEEGEDPWDITKTFPSVLINGIGMDGAVLRSEPAFGDLSDFNEWREENN